MVFSSPIFLLLFLPVALVLYGIARLPAVRRAGMAERIPNATLFLLSLVFYAWGEDVLVLGMLFVIAVNFACGRILASTDEPARRRVVLSAAIALSLGFLGFFKYFNFFVDSWNGLADFSGLSERRWLTAPEIALPLGVSFYTLQALSYSIDAYRRHIQPAKSFIDFGCYVSMFPQLVAGPIVRYRTIAGQLAQRIVTRAGFAEGVRRFIVGLGKKMLLADTIAVPTDAIFALEPSELSMALAWLGAICFTLQLYFDFSGYSDMAIGLGKMLGFDFPENFRHPLASRSLREMWTRWHISLSTWFRDYVYIPLGGNRARALRTHGNLIVVFFLSGLWHGAAFTYVAWGLFHAFFLVLERTRFGAWLGRAPRLLSHGYTLLVWTVGLVIFRSDTLDRAGQFMASMVFSRTPSTASELALYLTPEASLALVIGALFSFPLLPALGRFLESRLASLDAPLVPSALLASARLFGLATVLFLCWGLLASDSHNPFIYFRF